MSGLAVDSIGAYPSFYGTDSLRTDSLTPVQYAQLLKQYEQVAAASPTDSATQTMTTQRSVSPRYTKEESHTLRNALILAGAATLIYAAHKGGGITHIGKGFKEIGKSISNGWNKLCGKTSSVTEGVTKELKAIVGADKKLRYIIPGETTSIIGDKAVKSHAANSGFSLERLLNISSEAGTKIKSGTFEYIHEGAKKFASFKDGKLIQVTDAKGTVLKDILTSLKPEDVKLVDALEKRMAEITSMNKGWETGLKNITFSNTIGDNTLSFFRKNMESATKSECFKLDKTLKLFESDAKEVKAFFNGNANLEKIFAAYKEGKKLPDAMKVYSYTHKYTKDGTDTFCHIVNGEMTGITQNGKYFAKGSTDYEAFMHDDGETIKSIIERITKKKIVPEGAILTAA